MSEKSENNTETERLNEGLEKAYSSSGETFQKPKLFRSSSILEAQVFQ